MNAWAQGALLKRAFISSRAAADEEESDGGQSHRPFLADKLQAQALEAVLIQVTIGHRGQTLESALHGHQLHQVEIYGGRLDADPHPAAADVFSPPATLFDHCQLAVEVLE